MNKVFLIHGFQGSPNGGLRPWFVAELEKQDIYACALSMPDPENPVCTEWVEEISRYIERNKNDEDEGFELEWLTVNEAIKKFKKNKLWKYEAKFMSKRD